MTIYLKLLESLDFKDLFEFEFENRKYFEKLVPSRGNSYYQHEGFQERNLLLLEEQASRQSYFFLIKNGNNDIVGRLNLVNIDSIKKKSSIGYRVSEAYIGQGVASKALKILLHSKWMDNLNRIEAQTTTNNVASQKILEKNGFIFIKEDKDEFLMNGKSLRFSYYSKVV